MYMYIVFPNFSQDIFLCQGVDTLVGHLWKLDSYKVYIQFFDFVQKLNEDDKI